MRIATMSVPLRPNKTIISRTLIACLYLLGLETLLANSVFAADYYLSARGDDTHEGTSPGAAWRTIGRANRQALGPGDRLLFRGGDAFDGNLVVRISGSPSAKSPITIG